LKEALVRRRRRALLLPLLPLSPLLLLLLLLPPLLPPLPPPLLLLLPLLLLPFDSSLSLTCASLLTAAALTSPWHRWGGGNVDKGVSPFP